MRKPRIPTALSTFSMQGAYRNTRRGREAIPLCVRGSNVQHLSGPDFPTFSELARWFRSELGEDRDRTAPQRQEGECWRRLHFFCPKKRFGQRTQGETTNTKKRATTRIALTCRLRPARGAAVRSFLAENGLFGPFPAFLRLIKGRIRPGRPRRLWPPHPEPPGAAI